MGLIYVFFSFIDSFFFRVVISCDNNNNSKDYLNQNKSAHFPAPPGSIYARMQRRRLTRRDAAEEPQLK